MKGCHETHLAGYLDELMWHERYRLSSALVMQNIIGDIATQYPLALTIFLFFVYPLFSPI